MENKETQASTCRHCGRAPLHSETCAEARTPEREGAYIMSAEEVAQLLRNLGACIEARKWAEGKDLATIWSTCDQPDWLLWLVAHKEVQLKWLEVIRAGLTVPLAGASRRKGPVTRYAPSLP